jgi:DNA uptake protein ComE-like DNA-binding protein
MKIRATNHSSRDASVLVIVMWVALGLVAITLYFANAMLMNLKAADNRAAGLEADQAVEGAMLYVSNVLANRISPMTLPTTNYFHAAGVKIGDARFWVIGRDTNYSQTSLGSDTPTFGLIDEAGKININYMPSSNFQNFPGISINVAAAMGDWATTNTTPSSYGAKTETYSTLQPPYSSKNAPYETVDELRMVYNMNLDLYFGEDGNLNGALDPNENDGMKLPPFDNQNGTLDTGLADFCTTWTHESLVSTNGTNRIVVTNLTALQGFMQSNYSSLPMGVYASSSSGSASGGTGATGAGAAAAAASTAGPGSVLEFYSKTGMTPEQFETVEPFLINNAGGTNLVNINTASEEALAAIPGIGSNMAPQVLSYRQSNPTTAPTVTWLAAALNNNTTAIQQAGPCVTAFSYQFTADIVAVGHNNRGYRRVMFVFDCATGVPLVVYRQDLTYLGWPLGKKLHDQMLTGQFALNNR